MLSIRKEKPEDVSAINLVNELVFAQPTEAGIVDKLRNNCDQLLSLVVVEGDEIVGHILYQLELILAPDCHSRESGNLVFTVSRSVSGK